MSRVITDKQFDLLKELESCDLDVISIDPAGQWLRFEFISGLSQMGLVLKLFNPIFIKISRTLDDDGLFYVGEVSISPLGDGGKEQLTSLGFGFKDESGSVITNPLREMVHCHIEGGICVDVICESYQIYKEIK